MAAGTKVPSWQGWQPLLDGDLEEPARWSHDEAAREACTVSPVWCNAVADRAAHLEHTWSTVHEGLMVCDSHAPNPKGVLTTLAESVRGLAQVPRRPTPLSPLPPPHTPLLLPCSRKVGACPGSLHHRLLLQLGGCFTIASVHARVLPERVLKESCTMVTGSILMDVDTSEEFVPWGMIEGLLAKPQDVAPMEEKYATKLNGEVVARELLLDGSGTKRGSYFGALAQKASDAFRTSAAESASHPLAVWAEHAIRLLLVSMIAYTPRTLWQRCWGTRGRYGAGVHATSWRDGRCHMLFTPSAPCHANTLPSSGPHAMVSDMPGLAITAKYNNEDVNATELPHYLKHREAGLTSAQLRQACAEGHTLIFRAMHHDVVLVVDGVGDYVHHALGMCLCDPPPPPSRDASRTPFPHPILCHPSLALQGRLTCPNKYATKSGQPSWLLTLSRVAAFVGEEEGEYHLSARPRVVLTGHIVNAKNSLGQGKTCKAVAWHAGSVHDFLNTVRTLATALGGASGAPTLAYLSSSTGLGQAWKQALLRVRIPPDRMLTHANFSVC